MSHARSGIGYDSHRFEEGRKLILGGVEIPDADKGLTGHSDADVLTHAIIDALLGAGGLGDIGQHFPDTEDEWKDADSIVLLTEVCTFLEDHSFSITHIDATLICEAPKLAPHRDAMVASVAKLLDLPQGHVNVKATTTDHLGFIGRGEGICAMAICSVMLSAAKDPLI